MTTTRPGPSNLPQPGKLRDRSPFEQTGDAAAELADGLVLVGGDRVPVEADVAADRHAPLVGVLHGCSISADDSSAFDGMQP